MKSGGLMTSLMCAIFVSAPGRGEDRFTETAQRQVERGVHVQVVAADGSLEVLAVERERRKELEVLDEEAAWSFSDLIAG